MVVVGGGDGGMVVLLVVVVAVEVVVVVDRCDAVRSHLSSSLNSDCNFKYIPVSSKNCLKSQIY